MQRRVPLELFRHANISVEIVGKGAFRADFSTGLAHLGRRGNAGLARYHDVTTKGCYEYGHAVFQALGRQIPAYADWAQAPEARNYLHDSQSGEKPIFGPLLAVAGDDDRTVAIDSIVASVKRACARGLAIEFRHRAGLDHDPLMEQTPPELLAWARDRLAGKPWSDNCAAF